MTAQPNILLLVGEDTGAHLGCYDDPDARTPHLDRLAGEGLRARRAFTHCPVCAPSRSGLVTGRYPYSYGAHQMRSTLRTPPPLFLRELKHAGWHVSWPGKTDFNFDLDPHEISDTQDWEVHRFPSGSPWFCYANIFNTHESTMWPAPVEAWQRPWFAERDNLPAELRHDPARVRVPPYLPDHPAVRADIARHHDNASALDRRVGRILAQLDASGQADNTIVIFLADHGAGIPRGKRWCYDLGLRMPLIVRWPGRTASGTVHDGLIGWVDIGPQILAWCGLTVPPAMQGRPFLDGRREFAFAGRDRMDEQFDRIRTARSRNLLYIRNFRPDLPWAQRNKYLDDHLPSMRAWRELHAAGQLDPIQSAWFARTKPAEELYDCAADPWQLRNLAADPTWAAELDRHRAALDAHLAEVGDLGAVPERELIARGLVEDRLTTEYHQRTAPLPAPCDNLGGPWDAEGRPWRKVLP